MSLHGNAGLTIAQRKKVRELYQAGGTSYEKLAMRFGVSKSTIVKWANRENPEDHKSGPKVPNTVITQQYRQAVIDYRSDNEDHGPIRIAHELKKEYPFANRGTVLKILQSANLTKPKGEKKEA